MEDPSLKSSDSGEPAEHRAEPTLEFACNICGRANRAPESRLDREVGSCDGCQSTVRTRAVAQMISREMFGLDLAVPDFPVLRDVRGMGISDSPDYAERLAAKFTYRNTYYHKEPRFDILNIADSEWGTYDFVIASEVFEHVAAPANVPFENVFRLLKPGGLFFFTVPYTLAAKTTEHFPDLHDYRIVELAGHFVMVNRTRDGKIQVFEDLVFHGGGGETLELRVFTEDDLRSLMLNAGFRAVEVYGNNYAPFGIVREEDWSLPMTARKEPFGLTDGALRELIEQWRDMTSKYDALTAWASNKIGEDSKELAARARWAMDLDTQLKERTEWAMSLEKDVRHHAELARNFQKELEERTEWALRLEAENKYLQARFGRLYSSLWTKVGRALRLVKE
jgi:SAM-dependent methyltransferase